MNIGAIKQNLISLGFAEESDLEEFEDLGYVNDAINRAIDTICVQFPYIAKYEFEIDDTDEGIIYVDMSQRDGFLDFATETPVMISTKKVTKSGGGVFSLKDEAPQEEEIETFTKFNDYEIEMGTTLVIDASATKGTIRVYYEKECTIVDDETDEKFVPELPKKVHHLIPLLSAYYLWLDDDQVKATQYYNMYETELMTVQTKEQRPRMRILEGGM